MVIARYTAIADVGSTLLKLLRSNMDSELLIKPEMIGLCSPAEENDFMLLLYLYHIEESKEHAQAGWSRTTQSALALDLYYVVTAKSAAVISSKALDENTMMGNAMLILHQNRVLSGSSLEGALAENNDQIRISVVDRDEHQISAKVCEAENLVFRNPVCYKVGPVFIGDDMETIGRRITSL